MSRLLVALWTYIDDGTTPHGWGSSEYDDEGMRTKRTVLIEDGVLKSYMVDKLGGLKTGYTPTGSGRRQSYTYAPTSRMRNTFIAPGSTPQEDLFAGIDFGLYAKDMGGGQVSPGSGEYNFAVKEGYLIRNGSIAEPVRGAMLVGKGPDTIRKIAAVSDDLATAAGMCGSLSGFIPTEVGQPHLLVSELVVGGRSMSLSYDQARDYVLAQAQRVAVDVEVIARATRELTLASFDQTLSELTQARAGGLGLRVVIAGKTGYASSEERTHEALDWALQEAIENAELQTDNSGFIPAATAMGYQDLIGEGLSAGLEEKSQLALDFEAQLREDSRLKQVMISRYTEREVEYSLASTQGARGGYRNGFSGLIASIIMQDGESVKQHTDIDFEKEFHSLDPGRTAQDIRQKTARLLNAKALKTGRYRAYFEPTAFLSILQLVFFMFSGKSVLEGKSRFADKLGQRVATDIVTIIDDPSLEGGMGSRPFDAEGAPAKAVTIVDQGITQQFYSQTLLRLKP